MSFAPARPAGRPKAPLLPGLQAAGRALVRRVQDSYAGADRGCGELARPYEPWSASAATCLACFLDPVHRGRRGVRCCRLSRDDRARRLPELELHLTGLLVSRPGAGIG